MIDLSLTQFVVTTAIIWYSYGLCCGIYCHRYLTHKQIELSESVIAVFKVVLWLFMPWWSEDRYVRWVAMHIRHHNNTDKEADPHSPYRKDGTFMSWVECKEMHDRLNPRSFSEYTHLMENDKKTKIDYILLKFERIVNGRSLSAVILTLLFGFPGTIMWLIVYHLDVIINMSVINYLCHRFGYNTEPVTAISGHSKNFLPWGFLGLGEELHGNHHRHPRRANFGIKWWEIDPTYYVLIVMSWVGLAKINKND